MDTRPQLPTPQAPGQNIQASSDRGSNTDAHGQPLAIGGQRSDPGDKDAALTEQDRQYIDKAISIVESSARDPYEQSKAIDQIRTEYLGQRFGRQINNDA